MPILRRHKPQRFRRREPVGERLGLGGERGAATMLVFRDPANGRAGSSSESGLRSTTVTWSTDEELSVREPGGRGTEVTAPDVVSCNSTFEVLKTLEVRGRQR